MSILKVARMGHPVLRRRARALDKSDIRQSVVQKLVDDMLETMFEYHGVGLAGPQVHEDLRLFVAIFHEEPGAKSEATVVIKGGRIVSANVSQCLTRYPCSYIAALPGQVIARQSAQVDLVSRATDSSMAYRTAVTKALAQAQAT